MRKMNCYYQHLLQFTDAAGNNSISWTIINASAAPITDLSTAVDIGKGFSYYTPCNGFNSSGGYVYICGNIYSYNVSTKILTCDLKYFSKASGIVSGTVKLTSPSVTDTVTPLQ